MYSFKLGAVFLIVLSLFLGVLGSPIHIAASPSLPLGYNDGASLTIALGVQGAVSNATMALYSTVAKAATGAAVTYADFQPAINQLETALLNAESSMEALDSDEAGIAEVAIAVIYSDVLQSLLSSYQAATATAGVAAAYSTSLDSDLTAMFKELNYTAQGTVATVVLLSPGLQGDLNSLQFYQLNAYFGPYYLNSGN